MRQLFLFPTEEPRFEIFVHPHVSFEGRSPIVEGTRILVRRLWQMHQRGEPIAEIMARYKRVEPAAILSALAFAYDNRALIEWDEQQEKGKIDP
jgi:uncharacterized protein (DUF433 family)